MLSDSQRRIVKDYDVEKETGTALRTIFIIDKRGEIAHVFENVKVDGHTKEVIKALKEIK